MGCGFDSLDLSVWWFAFSKILEFDPEGHSRGQEDNQC